MGRGAAGVRGIKLPEGHEVIGLTIIIEDGFPTAPDVEVPAKDDRSKR